ncbi:MAG: carboxypeptidase-like regulatory domain-containing protein [Cyclobacteriaceae bacterium]|nr:carboxypeptidase-like regulatory domain-containing protein [Cyclobacteriaceae bacterium]
MKSIGILIVVFLLAFGAFGQKQPVKISGAIVDADEHTPIPFVHIQVNGSIYGTAADVNGYFTILVQAGDTLHFTSIGYAEALFVTPLFLDRPSYALLQLMRKESMELKEVVVFPWPEWEDFREAFLKINGEPSMEKKSLEVHRELNELSKAEYRQNRFYYDQMRYQRLYDLNGIIPPNNFLNPINWTNFIYDLKKKEE